MNKLNLPSKPYEIITTIDMWTDPYISLQMLKHHLDLTNDIASRRGEVIKKTTDFISSYLRNGDLICDFGCGPGLYASLLQKKGFNVIGCDVSKSSLEYAKKQNKSIDYREFNYINDQLDIQIDAAMMIYLDFGALSEKSQCKFLHLLHNTLKENGLFFFDVCDLKEFDHITEFKNEETEYDGFI